MKLVAKAIANLILSTTLIFGQTQIARDHSDRDKSSGSKTLTGVVSDTKCGARHLGKDKSAAECTRVCVKQGMKYALVTVNRVYRLEGHESELNQVAGTRATVKGNVSGEVLTVDSVGAAK